MTDNCTDIEYPLISVIMATAAGDSPGFLDQAVQSVLHQSYRDLELIIISDGELDSEKREYLEKVQRKDKRVFLLSTDRRVGPAGARNLGISQANGEFIAIMDADDISVEDRLKKQLEFIRASGADLVGSAYFEIDAAGALVGEKNMPQRHTDVLRTASLFSPVNGPTVFARSEVLRNHRYDERFRFGEDYRLWVTLLRNGYKIENMSEKLLYFRKGPSFYTDRRGASKAFSDLLNKLYAMKLVPVYKYPHVFAFGFISFLIRLLPERLLAMAYRIKYKLYN